MVLGCVRRKLRHREAVASARRAGVRESAHVTVRSVSMVLGSARRKSCPGIQMASAGSASGSAHAVARTGASMVLGSAGRKWRHRDGESQWEI